MQTATISVPSVTFYTINDHLSRMEDELKREKQKEDARERRTGRCRYCDKPKLGFFLTFLGGGCQCDGGAGCDCED